MNDSFNDSFNDSIYAYDYEDELCGNGEIVRFKSVVTPVFFSVVTALSLTGNILVLVILAFYENLKSLTNIFILNLAISDLVFTIGLPFWVIYDLWGWSLSETFCKIVHFVFFTGFYSSILILTIMTIYRYVAVVHPLSDMRMQKLSTGVFVSLLLWALSIGAAMPSLLFLSIIPIHQEDGHSQGCEYESDLKRDISVYQQNVFFLVAFAVMAFCYIHILWRIRKTRSNTKNRAVKLVFCIVAVFFVGWVPYNVVIFLHVLANNVIAPFDSCKAAIRIEYAYSVCRLVAFSHCCLNPVLYAFVGVKFRSHLKSMLHRLFVCQSSVNPEQQTRMHTFSRGSMY